jgi:ATP phosphoribosyltransferase
MKKNVDGKKRKLVLGLPKGSLQEITLTMLRKAGFAVRADARSYMPSVDDPEIDARLLRAQEISRYVELGVLDAGITGYDWIVENGSDVVEVAELLYAKQGLRPVKWVVAVPENSRIRRIKDLAGKRIATEAVGLTRRFLKKNRIKVQVEFSWGATEAKVPDLADAIVELTETGASLRAHGLRIVETVLESTTRFIANKSAWKNSWKRAKAEQIAMLLKGALAAESTVLLKMNVRTRDLQRVMGVLPAMRSPTVNHLSQKDWVAVESVVEEKIVREIIPQLKKAGAEGIIELGLNKIIP